MDVNFDKAMREARERQLRDLVGVSFQDAKGDWIRVSSVGSEGVVHLEDASTGDPTTFVERGGWPDLLVAIRRSSQAKDAMGMLFMVAGEGERVVTDWVYIVLHSGYRVRDLLAKGIVECMQNPKLGKEAWT